MLINSIITHFSSEKQTIVYDQIDIHINIVAFFIAFYLSLMSTIGFTNYLYSIFLVLVPYLLIDSLFLPFAKTDVFFHHIIVIILLILGLNKSYEFHQQITKVLLLCEASSIFLSPCYILKKLKKRNEEKYKQISTIMDYIFITSFFYVRIVNLTYEIVFHQQKIDFLLHACYDYHWAYLFSMQLSLYSFLLLNYYWAYRIVNTLFIKLNKKQK